MRYIIEKYYEDSPDIYLYRDFPSIRWTDDVTLALRMHPERAASISYHLMKMGVSHCIIQKNDFQ